MSEHRNQGRIFWGLLLVVLGVLFLLDRTHTLDFGDLVSRFWPVVFILIGLSILFSNNFRNTGSGLFFILFGTFFLLLQLRILDHDIWRYLWPVAIIAVGLWILFRPAWHPDKKKVPEMSGDAADELVISQVFSGTVRKVESQSFRGGKVDIVFGSAEIDLRGARLSGGQATLTASVVFGGLTVFVPRDWQVLLQGTPVLGSIEAHRTAANGGVPTGVLTIRGSAVFGSIDIKE